MTGLSDHCSPNYDFQVKSYFITPTINLTLEVKFWIKLTLFVTIVQKQMKLIHLRRHMYLN